MTGTGSRNRTEKIRQVVGVGALVRRRRAGVFILPIAYPWRRPEARAARTATENFSGIAAFGAAAARRAAKLRRRGAHARLVNALETGLKAISPQA